MTLAALVRSIVAVGFDGCRAADAPLAELAAFGPGACILFARNAGSTAEVRELVQALRELGEPPPLIAIDQEGGRVSRLRAGVAQLPAAMAIAAAGDAAGCEELAMLLGRDLARLGISVNLAPVADLAVDPANTAIGTRSFGADPLEAGRFAGAFARGLGRGGVAAALKHFPGHGSTATDSHVALPHVTAAEDTLRARDLVPFASVLATAGVPIVMTAHVVFDALDPTRPATMSPRIIGGLLRGELGFDGVVCTDCLEMDAVAATFGTPAAALAALAAGADLLLVSHTFAVARAVVETIVAAVEARTLPLERVTEAARRVRALRERYATLAPYGGHLDENLPAAVMRDGVTLVRGDARLPADRPVTVISFEGDEADGAGGPRAGRPSLSAALRARRWKSELMRVALDPERDDIDLLLAHLPALGERNFVVTTRRAHLHPAQRAAVELILEVVPAALIVSAAEPYDALLWPAARSVVCIYGDDELAFEACADALSGAAQPRGILPVPVTDAALR